MFSFKNEVPRRDKFLLKYDNMTGISMSSSVKCRDGFFFSFINTWVTLIHLHMNNIYSVNFTELFIITVIVGINEEFMCLYLCGESLVL